MMKIYALLTLLQRDRAAMSDGTPPALVYRYLNNEIAVWMIKDISLIST